MLRRSKQMVATSIDGVKDNVPGHFKDIYSKLYNSVDAAANMAKLSTEVENNIS